MTMTQDEIRFLIEEAWISGHCTKNLQYGLSLDRHARRYASRILESPPVLSKTELFLRDIGYRWAGIKISVLIALIVTPINFVMKVIYKWVMKSNLNLLGK